MPTGQARTPQPSLPPPATDPSSPASTSSTHHRRHRTFSSSSSSSSSSLSTVSSAASSPSPSPRGGGVRSATSVPFSWEHHPGIPKTRLPAAASPPAPAPLPLPPPLRAPPSRTTRHHQQTRRRRAGSSSSSISSKAPATDADPFAAALAACTRERAGADSDRRLMDSLFPSSSPSPAAAVSCAPSGRRWPSIVNAGGVVGLLDMYGCKSAMGVAEGAFVVRRPVAVVRPGHGRAGLGRTGRR
ncbi:unnamed protein product [Urochloa decumbens]|uniref:Uncharacterized protein n=1 Tax=Urochloa decumbens TaxID=240449 RepID=A0ABC9B5L6_9POAL